MMAWAKDKVLACQIGIIVSCTIALLHYGNRMLPLFLPLFSFSYSFTFIHPFFFLSIILVPTLLHFSSLVSTTFPIIITPFSSPLPKWKPTCILIYLQWVKFSSNRDTIYILYTQSFESYCQCKNYYLQIFFKFIMKK